MKRISLRARIALVMGLLLAVSAITIVLVIRGIAKTRLETDIRQATETRQLQFDQAFLDILNRVTVSHLDVFDDPGPLTETLEDPDPSKAEKTAFFRSQLAETPLDADLFAEVVIYHDDEFYRGGLSEEVVSHPDVQFLRSVLEATADTLHFAGIHTDGAGDPHFVFARQIRTMYPDSRPFAVALFYVRGAVIEDMLVSLTPESDEGFSLLLGPSGQPLFPADSASVIAKAGWNPTEAPAFSTAEVEEETVILIRRELSEASQTYPRIAFSVLGVFSRTRLLANLDRLNTYIFIIGAVSLVLVGIIATLLARQMTSPIRKLIHNLRTFGKTKTRTRILTADDRDEIVELEKTYDEMIGQIVSLIETNNQEMDNKRKLELYALQMQINPHFLYNTLDTIAWMAKLKKEPDIERLVLALAKFFRISLHKGDKFIRIEEEFELIRHFVDIQMIRFPNLFEVSYELDPAIADVMTLKLILQPVVENAIKHGFAGLDRLGHLKIRAFAAETEEIRFEVEDDGIGFEPSEDLFSEKRLLAGLGGYGLKNVDERIKLEYGREFGVSVDSRPDYGTKVSIRIKKNPTSIR